MPFFILLFDLVKKYLYKLSQVNFITNKAKKYTVNNCKIKSFLKLKQKPKFSFNCFVGKKVKKLTNLVNLNWLSFDLGMLT